jgi:hypothetical protein
LLVGSTSILDLRLLGWAFRGDSASKLARRYLSWTWAGLAIQVVTGFLLFTSQATKMYGNLSFQIKMLLILLAGVNVFVFHTLAYRKVATWDDAPIVPLSARCAGCFSMLLWIGVVAAGRWIAFI